MAPAAGRTLIEEQTKNKAVRGGLGDVGLGPDASYTELEITGDRDVAEAFLEAMAVGAVGAASVAAPSGVLS